MRVHPFSTISAFVPLCVVVIALNGVTQTVDRSNARLIGRTPLLALESSNAATPDEQSQITLLIDQLAQIQDPDFGFAPTMAGVQFAPVDGSSSFNGGIIMIDHGLKTNESLKKLVAFGPKALPQLLDRLTDQTPTKLTMQHGDGRGIRFGAQWYGQEVSMNKLNSFERSAYDKHHEFLNQDSGFYDHDRHVNRHPIAIGDVCFVIIGQIVNRDYQATRYQPTACQVINSPVHDPEIAEVVREVWASDDPAARLANSLRLDLFTRDENDWQCGAAMRLLYDFPNESAELIASMIPTFLEESLRVSKDPDNEHIGTSVNFEAFLNATRVCRLPVITDALTQVVARTQNPIDFDAALTDSVAKKSPQMVLARMKHFLAVAPEKQETIWGEDHVLKAAAKYFPDDSKELFELYRDYKTWGTTHSTIQALDEPVVRRQWMTDYLAARLDDRTETDLDYEAGFDVHPIRVCDEAAAVLAKNYLPGVRFVYEENPGYLDLQIAKIKRVLAGEKGISFPPPERPVLPADLPQRTAKVTTEVKEEIGRLYGCSTDEVLWAGMGYRAPAGWAWDTLQINPQTGEIVKRIPIDVWNGGVSMLPNAPADRIFAYHGDEGGDVLIRDVRTGQILKKVPTPFHDGVSLDDPLQIRNLSDVTLCGKNSEWIVALTPDGALHSINVESGQHRIEWKPDENTSGWRVVRPVHGTSRVWFTVPSESSLSDEPHREFDLASRTLQSVDKVSSKGTGWGDFATVGLHDSETIWSIPNKLELKLPDRDKGIQEIIFNHDQSRAYVLRSDGSVEIYLVQNGTTLKPILRVVPPVKRQLDVSIVLGDQERRLFWLGIPRDEPDDRDHPIEPNTSTVIAVFDCDGI